ncbi:hypothetical protein K466DRAFT_162361 [Polyporus arcularius HHB13444]|uniref:Uncharacterized protein n=1 Tax=Polyporus arcularius HHB13444 TaxID=1314778 RepID=A0A5C3P950_9APHY|nr:hypothetical protein K466DRAFT_162361 [Polyporus arcularius HHB13444]
MIRALSFRFNIATRAASHALPGLMPIHATIARHAIQYGTVNCLLPRRRRADAIPPDSCALAIQEPARTRKQSEHTTGIATAHTYCLNDRGAGASQGEPSSATDRLACVYSSSTIARMVMLRVSGREYVGPIYMLKRRTHTPIAIKDRAGTALACELVCLLTTGGRSLRISMWPDPHAGSCSMSPWHQLPPLTSPGPSLSRTPADPPLPPATTQSLCSDDRHSCQVTSLRRSPASSPTLRSLSTPFRSAHTT